MSEAKVEVNVTTASINLEGGGSIPTVGLGVYLAQVGNEAQEAVANALKAGYRHIDTAQCYDNEEDVGIAVKNSGIPREAIFITTKLWVWSKHGYDAGIKAVERSLRKLQMDYVDLFLIHSPFKIEGRLESWRALEEIKNRGLAKHIGVSNYGKHHLEVLLKECKIKPVVNQIEISPYLQRRELVEYCAQNGIVVEAYSPLTKGEKLNDPKLVEVAKSLGVTPAQVLIRWCIQKGYVVLPKSVKMERIQENANVFNFTIPEATMQEMDSWEEGLVTGWDPTVSE
jgi:diketogulonate reductase-like aldo/keto reductase